MTGGDPERGAATIYHFGCGSCHTIRGVAGAHGQVGPVLTGVGARQFIAGELENDPSNLERWIEDPHAVNEHTVMPTLGVKPNDAADIAAYLYSLN